MRTYHYTKKNKAEDIIPISEEALGLIGYNSEKKGLVFKRLMRSWTQIPMKEWIRSAGITKNITFPHRIVEHLQRYKQLPGRTSAPYRASWRTRVSPPRKGISKSWMPTNVKPAKRLL